MGYGRNSDPPLLQVQQVRDNFFVHKWGNGDWEVCCFGFNGPFETMFLSISSRLPKRGRKRRERTDDMYVYMLSLKIFLIYINRFLP